MTNTNEPPLETVEGANVENVLNATDQGEKCETRPPNGHLRGDPCSLESPAKQGKLDNIPDIHNYRETYCQAMAGNSRKAAVKSFCLECVCWEREEVRKCTSPACPLYPYRPYK